MKIRHIYFAALALAVSFMASCSDDDVNYSPGEPVSADCQQVHFTADNDTSLLLGASDDPVMTLTVKRNTTVGALEVPINVMDNEDGFTLPDKVVFADGESTTTVEVTGPEGMETNVPYSFRMELTGEHIDPYTQLDGTARFFGSMTIATTYEATVYFGNYKLGSCKQEVVQLSTTQYRMSNFLHSGKTLIINVSGTNVSFAGDCGVSLSGYWCFSDEAENYFPLYFSEDTSDTYITDLAVYISYCHARLTAATPYFQLYGWVGFSDGDSGWLYLYISL